MKLRRSVVTIYDSFSGFFYCKLPQSSLRQVLQNTAIINKLQQKKALILKLLRKIPLPSQLMAKTAAKIIQTMPTDEVIADSERYTPISIKLVPVNHVS